MLNIYIFEQYIGCKALGLFDKLLSKVLQTRRVNLQGHLRHNKMTNTQNRNRKANKNLNCLVSCVSLQQKSDILNLAQNKYVAPA